MTIEVINGISAQVIKTILVVSGPALIVSLAVGLIISFFQAVTQIQEFTLTFVPKILAVFACVFLMLPFLISVMVDFTTGLISNIPAYIR
jgi:flagellar biosynthetic protein FliQ